MMKLGGTHCEKCGCDIIAILEINHKNGGGAQQQRTKGHYAACREVLNSANPEKKFNILCRVCNAQHYVEEILGYHGHQVFWKK